ncbi:hypothetical protein CfE428DRAFT_5829 [Chthoniobacter flavus Ellin428]|uniref:Uncharacterized protein n=1 Tax=Chthoniobacter flavus Ellin428 TaxID=497964 RepID=B4DA89_9BACT|nr:hypothetical protein [Chthoniobacter flavus]EDY16716.1 hypothetical protein CfE428DRAFT_5829 [Chthoniobacter flavus Ellin428]TCO87282.1 hypothetical protein EV701_123119 [Chthoniobacter flavus]
MSVFHLTEFAWFPKCAAYLAGAEMAKEHFARGHYNPQANPHVKVSTDGRDWDQGYEDAWEAAFFAKRTAKAH